MPLWPLVREEGQGMEKGKWDKHFALFLPYVLVFILVLY